MSRIVVSYGIFNNDINVLSFLPTPVIELNLNRYPTISTSTSCITYQKRLVVLAEQTRPARKLLYPKLEQLLALHEYIGRPS